MSAKKLSGGCDEVVEDGRYRAGSGGEIFSPDDRPIGGIRDGESDSSGKPENPLGKTRTGVESYQVAESGAHEKVSTEGRIEQGILLVRH